MARVGTGDRTMLHGDGAGRGPRLDGATSGGQDAARTHADAGAAEQGEMAAAGIDQGVHFNGGGALQIEVAAAHADTGIDGHLGAALDTQRTGGGNGARQGTVGHRSRRAVGSDAIDRDGPDRADHQRVALIDEQVSGSGSQGGHLGFDHIGGGTDAARRLQA